MLVRRLFGPYANEVIDMNYVDAVAAIRGESVAPVTEADIAKFTVRQIVDAAGALAEKPTLVASEPVKRKGGWPRGKPRKPRAVA